MMRPKTYNFPDNEVLKNETELLVTALMTPNMFRGGKHNCSSAYFTRVREAGNRVILTQH